MDRSHSILLLLLVLFLVFSVSLANEAGTRATYIVFVTRPHGANPAAFDRSLLTSVLGSKEAARKAFKFSYRYVIDGFAATLIPKEVEELKKLPAVYQVMPDRKHILLDSGGKGF